MEGAVDIWCLENGEAVGIVDLIRREFVLKKDMKSKIKSEQ
jgi:hypothetical protein